MKESEEDISARAEEILKLACDYAGTSVFNWENFHSAEVISFIEGYKACLAAQSQSVEESKADLKVKCHDCNGTGNTQDFLTQVFGAEEDHCNRCSGTGVEIISNLKVSKERMYTERDMIAFGVFIGFYQKLDIEEVLEIFNKESGNSEKPNNHIESFEKEINAIVGRYSNELTKPELVSKLAYILKSCELS